MTNRAEQRLDRAARPAPTSALAHQPDQRGAVAVVGLEPPRPQLRSAPPASPTARTTARDPGQRRSSSAVHARCSDPVASIAITGVARDTAGRDQPLELVDALRAASAATPARRSTRARRSSTTPDSTTLPGSIATTNVSAGSASRSRLDTSNLLSRKKEGTERASRTGAPQTSSVPISGSSPKAALRREAGRRHPHGAGDASAARPAGQRPGARGDALRVSVHPLRWRAGPPSPS